MEKILLIYLFRSDLSTTSLFWGKVFSIDIYTDEYILHFMDTGIVINTMHSLNWLHQFMKCQW